MVYKYSAVVSFLEVGSVLQIQRFLSPNVALFVNFEAKRARKFKMYKRSQSKQMSKSKQKLTRAQPSRMCDKKLD
jgi:hypothetical protein